MAQYEVRHQCDMKCSDCSYFDYDEIFDGEEEYGYFMCGKDHCEHIGWGVGPCEDFKFDRTR